MIREIETLSIIVTSRPDSGISTSPYLRVFKVSELQGKEHEDVIRKMSHDIKIADSIISEIKKGSSQVSHLLRTPLMIALLMVRYKIDQSLPQNTTAFYESLFELLLQRHDKNKGGWVRPRKSSASDSTLLDFFNALAFVTRKAGETSFTNRQLKSHCRSALSIIGEKLDADKTLDDIVEITCLILRDGEESRYIHKSVQEYHAALFLKAQPDETAVKFYTAMHDQSHLWQQELNFLSQIDRFRYLKYFYLPLGYSALTGSDNPDSPIPNFSITVALRLFGDDQIEFSKTRSGVVGLKHDSSYVLFPLDEAFEVSAYVSSALSLKRALLPSKIIRESDNFHYVMIRDILKNGQPPEKIWKGCLNTYNSLRSKVEQGKSWINHVEKNASLFDF